LGLGGGRGTVLVAVEEDDGKPLGTVMLDPSGADREVARDADEAELRMLAVAPRAQGQGVAHAPAKADQQTR
jgi:GNAT superfamily N-acetyltransferase